MRTGKRPRKQDENSAPMSLFSLAPDLLPTYYRPDMCTPAQSDHPTLLDVAADPKIGNVILGASSLLHHHDAVGNATFTVKEQG
jgi:hypothetical protein